MKKKSLPLSRVYQLLEPGPVVLLAAHWRGRSNLMTMSWHMMVEFEPPMLACIVSGDHYTFELLRKSKECTINIPTVEVAQPMVRCGNTSGRRLDKFQALGLTPAKAAKVAAPLVAECYANLECTVVDTRMVNRYNLFILEVVAAWIDPAVKEPRTLHHEGYGRFMVAGKRIKLRSRMK
jgi:flavin reductase (DIM6/NTAB) family NADH-FMN oxidoreductase RutF